MAYLKENPSEAKSLIWTLNLELTPIYAIEPYGPYGEVVYTTLVEALDQQNKDAKDLEYVNRVSIPGVLTGDTVKLFSGQVVPVLAADSKRGIYGWTVNQVIAAALKVVETLPAPPPPRAAPTLDQLTGAVTSFLNRIYYEYRNLGVTSAEAHPELCCHQHRPDHCLVFHRPVTRQGAGHHPSHEEPLLPD